MNDLQRAALRWAAADAMRPDEASAEFVKLLVAEVERLTALGRVSAENHRALWAALRMVRDAIEEVGPVGILPSIEHEGVEPHQVAEHFVTAIAALAADKETT